MASKTLDSLTAATALVGTEEVYVVQSGNSRKTTAQDIADLGTSQDNMTDGTTNKNYSATDKTKVGHLTVTGDVDLDTISTKVGHITVAADIDLGDAVLNTATDASTFGFVLPDDDTLAGASATKLARSKNVKAYTDARTTVATQAQAEDGTDNITVLTPLRLTQKLKKDGYLSIYQMGVSDPSADNDTAIDSALAEAFPILFPSGDWNIGATMTIRAGGGILGYGEATNLQRNFTGGAVVEFGGGNSVGDPIRLENFRVSLGSTPLFASLASTDVGVQIGFTTAWAGRGMIANLLLDQQYNGLKWKGGTTQPIFRVYATNCAADGFSGINPRGELLQCFSGQNGGYGITSYQETTGETGFYVNGCTTYANAQAGIRLTGAAAQTAANQYIRGHVSSFDNDGLVTDGTPASIEQVSIVDFFAEYMGQAHLNNTLASQNLTAVGVYLGPNVKNGKIQSVQIMNANAHGIWLDQCQNFDISGLEIEGCGQQYATNGSIGAGILNNGTNCSIRGYVTNPSNTNAQADVNIQSGATGRMSGFAGDLTWAGTASGLVVCDCAPDKATITISSTVTLPQVGDTFIFNGSGTVDQIAPSFEGREVTILAGAAITIGNTGNIFLASAYSMAAGYTLKLKMMAGNWREIGRASPRAS